MIVKYAISAIPISPVHKKSQLGKGLMSVKIDQ
jgi:hypothetical protein